MKSERVSDTMHKGMQGVRLSPELRARTLNAMRGNEERSHPVKRKFSVAMACALLGIMLLTAALAVANHKGLLDFIQRDNQSLPETVSDYVQAKLASGEGDGLHVAVQEAIYDGRRLRMTADLRMDGEKPLLMAMDLKPNDSFSRLGGADGDARTILDAYRAGGYTELYSIAASIGGGAAEPSISSLSGDLVLQEDGTLTCYYEIAFLDDAPQRTITLRAEARQYRDEDGQLRLSAEPCAAVDVSFTLNASESEERYVSAEPVEYADVGVRVDRVVMTVQPLEIDYRIEFSVIDPEKYAALDDGLWFEFIDPDSTAAEPYDQRLKAGVSGYDAANDSDETGVHERTGSLALSERADVYALRAYECWDKQRFDTHEIRMVKAD